MESDWGPDYDAYPNAWAERPKKPLWDRNETDIKKKLLGSAHYNPVIQLETMSLTAVRIMLGYTYLLAIYAVVYTTYIHQHYDLIIEVWVLKPVLAVGYAIFLALFLRNCCCDCLLFKGRSKRVREQVWILLTLIVCAICAAEFEIRQLKVALRLSKTQSHKSDRVIRIITSSVLTSVLKLLWLMLMDSYGRIEEGLGCSFYFWKLLFAIVNIGAESTLLIRGFSPYGTQVMLTTWVLYGVWCIWLVILMVRSGNALDEYSYIQTRLRQLGFRFFCFQTTVVMSSIIACLGISAYRREHITAGYQVAAHGYMLLLGWCYMALPDTGEKGKHLTLESETAEVFEHLRLPKETEFSVAKMCLFLSWEVYRIPAGAESQTNPFRIRTTSPPPEDFWGLSKHDQQPTLEDVEDKNQAVELMEHSVEMSEEWKSLGGWSIPLSISPLLIRVFESEEHIRCLVARMPNPDALLVSFRGTANVRNMITDCTAWRIGPHDFDELSSRNYLSRNGVYVHSGFWAAYQSIRPALIETLRKYLNPEIKNLFENTEDKAPPIVFTGHSLGGALASLAALDFATMQGIKIRKIGCITFGQPRVGNRSLARLLDDLIPSYIRVVFERDAITGQPGIPILFKHAGSEIVVDDKGNCIPKPSFIEKTFMGSKTHFGNHSMTKYLQAFKSNIALLNSMTYTL